MKNKSTFTIDKETAMKAVSNNIPELIKRQKIRDFIILFVWLSAILIVELFIGYLASLFWVKDLKNIICNIMLVSIGFLMGTLNMRIRI